MTRFCQRCERQTEVHLAKTRCKNGAQAIYEVCLLKGAPHRVVKNGNNLSHAEVIRRGFKIEDIPIILDNIVIGCSVTGCEEEGISNHHWAPKSIFGSDAGRWPTSPLCPKHHKEWHDRTHTKY